MESKDRVADIKGEPLRQRSGSFQSTPRCPVATAAQNTNMRVLAPELAGGVWLLWCAFGIQAVLGSAGVHWFVGQTVGSVLVIVWMYKCNSLRINISF